MQYAPTINIKNYRCHYTWIKGAVSRRIGYSVWQRNYYEHIIRNQHSYDEIEEYILNNTFLLEKDNLFIE